MLTSSPCHSSTLEWHPHELAYCSNVHPGESLEEINDNITRYFTEVKNTRGLEKMASGLWLSAKAAEQLLAPAELSAFKQGLLDAGVCLSSLNGFPYGNFHQDQVKQAVYSPDWSSVERLTYSKNLAHILATCMPEDISMGAISSLPLGYRADWNPLKHTQAINQLLALNLYLDGLEQQTGNRILLCLEMEPDCVLESTSQLIQFFTELTQANGENPSHIGVCIDVCHQAVMHEDVYDALMQIYQAGIPLGKIQVSNAISVDVALLKQADATLMALLWQYAEAKYLHQVKAKTDTGQVLAWSDLNQVLEQMESDPTCLDKLTSFRVHFHVPLNCTLLNHSAMTTLHDDLHRVFDFLAMVDANHAGIKPILEVETYSWQVLPSDLQPHTDTALIDGIVRELSWLEQQLVKKGMRQP